jgi:hypothetical protein
MSKQVTEEPSVLDGRPIWDIAARRDFNETHGAIRSQDRTPKFPLIVMEYELRKASAAADLLQGM